MGKKSGEGNEYWSERGFCWGDCFGSGVQDTTKVLEMGGARNISGRSLRLCIIRLEYVSLPQGKVETVVKFARWGDVNV